HSKGMVDIRDRPEPSDSHVRFGGPVLDAKIGDIERDIGPSLAQCARAAIHRIFIEGGSDRRKRRPLQPGGGKAATTKCGLHIHGRYAIVVPKPDIVFPRPY